MIKLSNSFLNSWFHRKCILKNNLRISSNNLIIFNKQCPLALISASKGKSYHEVLSPVIILWGLKLFRKSFRTPKPKYLVRLKDSVHLPSKDAFQGIVKEMLVTKNLHEAISISFTVTCFSVAKIALQFWGSRISTVSKSWERVHSVSPGKHNSTISR